MKKQIAFEYQFFTSESDLDVRFRKLLSGARDAVGLSYAPYSKFHVGAALLMSNGEIVRGGNQENASFPAGICAERVALSTASSLFPFEKVLAIAIAYSNPENPDNQENILSPCGICRQSILETLDRQQRNIEVLLSSPSGKIILLENARNLLPLAFSSSSL